MALGTIFVVATPLGNLADASERLRKTLTGVDAVACEDTRVARKLMAALGIGSTAFISYHQHSGAGALGRISNALKAGKNIALITDAGTPTISDPGGKLIADLVAEFGPAISVVPVPGPSAVTALLSVAGLPADAFLFLGFPPRKNGRAKFFARVAESPDTVVLYESPHRIGRTLSELTERLVGSDPANAARAVVIGRELTKLFETIYRGTVANAAALIPEKDQRGEFAVAVAGKWPHKRI